MKRLFFLTVMALSAVTFLASAPVGAEPQLDGIAYIQGHGGHVAVINLTTGDVGRITHGKPSDALTLSQDAKTLFMFSLDGYAKEVDLEGNQQTEWSKLGKKHCGSGIAPDGTIWVSDMADGHVYVYDPKTKSLADSFAVSKSICGINFSKDGKYAYISDMPGGFINIVDVKTKKIIGKIENVGKFIHRSSLNPTGSELWQADGAELYKGKAVGVGYASAGASPGGVTVVDVKEGRVKDRIITGGNAHDVTFSPDGRYALVAVRQVPERDDSSIVVINTDAKRVEKMYSTCKICHGSLGVKISEDKDGGRPFLCAVNVDWGRRSFPNAVEVMGQFTER